MTMMMLRASDIGRAYPVSDGRRPRLTSVRNGQGLPGFGRSRLKKLVRVRVGTLNVGSMSGRGRESADLMESIIIVILIYLNKKTQLHRSAQSDVQLKT